MGFKEKLNPNSLWYKKRHSEEVKPTPVAPVVSVKPTLKQKLIKKIRKFFYLPK